MNEQKITALDALGTMDRTPEDRPEPDHPIYVRTVDRYVPIARVVRKPDMDMTVRFFDREDVDLKSDEIVAINAPGCGTTCIRRKHIVKQADAIEELFDEYVLESKDHTYQSLLVKSDRSDKRSFAESFTEDVKDGWRSYCSTYLQSGYEIYGAVVVRGEHDEPILKPAAKMKEEGEWELL